MKKLINSFSLGIALIGFACVNFTHWFTDGDSSVTLFVGGFFTIILGADKARKVIQSNKGQYYDENEGVVRTVE